MAWTLYLKGEVKLLFIAFSIYTSYLLHVQIYAQVLIAVIEEESEQLTFFKILTCFGKFTHLILI